MVGLVAVDTNKALFGTLPAHVARLATTITYQACYPTGHTMRLVALSTMAPALLASAGGIGSLGLLSLPYCYMNLLWLPLCTEL